MHQIPFSLDGILAMENYKIPTSYFVFK